LHAALLLGADRTVRTWELEALEIAVASGLEITTLLLSTNDPRPSLRARHMAHDVLAFISRTGRSMRRRSDVTPLLSDDVRVLSFESEWHNGLQHLPAHVTDQLDNIDVVITFGANRLDNPASIPSTYGVASYHHGSAKMPRGHLAGFYELDNGEPVLRVVVQQRTNSRDAGRILAQGYSRVVPTSFKATLNDAKALGTPLLAQGLERLQANNAAETIASEPAPSLPKNRDVLRALAKTTGARLGRLFYGGFREKRWNVAYVPGTFDPENTDVPHIGDLQPLELAKGYTFAADPCAHHNGRLYVELMHAGKGKGEIFAYDNGTWRHVDVPVNGGHLSYPQIFEYDGKTYLFPEMADVGPPAFFEFNDQDLTCGPAQQLLGLENERVVDTTLIEHEGHWYLFCSPAESANERLDLWVADCPYGPWTLHPSSPICLDPRRARMGGPILRVDDRMYRTGQNGSVEYGQSATINRIEKLTPAEYVETWIRPFAVKGAFGPHTVLPNGNGYWIDYYTEKTTPLAGIRRLRGLLK